ncbi:hypothetical protein NST02_04975 [Robertmurraya sp. FSL W8-0741]|uniref:hypothetical protein n=1 Tax=Robertmurraya sp. FSL W8-0741 TaxID=2954629 RepID=UPI0030FB6668
MGQTLIVHDEKGYILSVINGQPEPREPQGAPFLWVDIPEGKRLKITDGIGVDVSVTPPQAILEDIPPSETELIKEENLTLKLAIAELAETQEQAKLETQLALAELAESLHGGDE